MRVEVLYFQGCPNHEAAVKRVQSILADEGVAADVLQIEVPDTEVAASVNFVGSPSVRINETDVERPLAAQGAVGLSCRMYMNGLVREGIPPAELIRNAIRKARDVSK
jgi:hypothetical protein